MSHRQRGTIRIWKDDKGYGFITPQAGGPYLFFHVTSITNTTTRDLQGQEVTYTTSTGKDGKPAAENISLTGSGYANVREKAPRSYRPQYTRFSTGIILMAMLLIFPFFALLAYLIKQHKLPWPILAVYGVMSIVTFAVMQQDKQKSIHGYWRTSESALHFLELLGGWPGSLIAQRLYRHKISKPSYQAAFWIIVILHLAVPAYLCGKKYLPANFLPTPSAPAQTDRPLEDRIRIKIYYPPFF